MQPDDCAEGRAAEAAAGARTVSNIALAPMARRKLPVIETSFAPWTTSLRPHPAVAMLAGAAVAGGTLMALSQPTPEQAQQQPAQTPQPAESQPQEANPVAAT